MIDVRPRNKTLVRCLIPSEGVCIRYRVCLLCRVPAWETLVEKEGTMVVVPKGIIFPGSARITSVLILIFRLRFLRLPIEGTP